MALTDINTVTGIYDFIRECDKVGIKPLVGMEFRWNHQFRYIGLAKNAEGLGEMNRFLTKHNFSGEPLPINCSRIRIGFCDLHFRKCSGNASRK